MNKARSYPHIQIFLNSLIKSEFHYYTTCKIACFPKDYLDVAYEGNILSSRAESSDRGNKGQISLSSKGSLDASDQINILSTSAGIFNLFDQFRTDQENIFSLSAIIFEL